MSCSTLLKRSLKNKELKSKDEQLLLFKIIEGYLKEIDGEKKLYSTLVLKNLLELENLNINVYQEAEPKTKRKKEGNTSLDLALGSIKKREYSEMGIEYDESIGGDFIFCEAKWESDISTKVTHCSIRNQLQRVIENALTFTNSNKVKNIFVVLITPKEYKNNYENGIYSRLYAYKYDEYKKNKDTFFKEINEIKKRKEIPFKELKYEKFMNKNIEKLVLNWVTIEELIKNIPNENIKNEIINSCKNLLKINL